MRTITSSAYRTLLFLAAAQVLLWGALGCGSRRPAREQPLAPPAQNYERIVSMSPSVTEMLFELGLGAKVVGVTTFCLYPEEARSRANIGGFHDANYEAIFALQPDLVVKVGGFGETDENCRELGLNSLSLETATISDILESVRVLGQACGVAERANEVVGHIERQMAEVGKHAQDGPHPRVLVSIGRNMGTGRIEDLYVAGKGTLYGEMIILSGGVNAYEGLVPYAKISREGLLRMNPEVIVDLVPDLDTHEMLTRDVVMQEWHSLSQLDAIKNKRVYLYGGNYVCIPGPRISRVLRDISVAVSPVSGTEEP